MTTPKDIILGQGRFIHLISRDGWEFIDHPRLKGIVVIVAVNQEGQLVLVEQFRKPLNARAIELPAGMVGDLPGQEDEEFAKAAQRELREETGYVAGSMEFLTEGPASPGRSTFLYTFFRASDLRREGAGGGDGTEDIVVHEVPLAGVENWLAEQARRGLLIDPKIFAGLYFVMKG